MKSPNSINCSILEKEYRLERFYTKWLDLFPIIPGINTLAQNMYHYEWSNATIGNFSWYEFHQRSAKAYGIKDLKQHIKDLKDQIEYEKRQLEIIVVDNNSPDDSIECIKARVSLNFYIITIRNNNCTWIPHKIS